MLPVIKSFHRTECKYSKSFTCSFELTLQIDHMQCIYFFYSVVHRYFNRTIIVCAVKSKFLKKVKLINRNGFTLREVY